MLQRVPFPCLSQDRHVVHVRCSWSRHASSGGLGPGARGTARPPTRPCAYRLGSGCLLSWSGPNPAGGQIDHGPIGLWNGPGRPGSSGRKPAASTVRAHRDRGRRVRIRSIRSIRTPIMSAGSRGGSPSVAPHGLAPGLPRPVRLGVPATGPRNLNGPAEGG
jgi:hypothetical protein